jgi:phosphoribosyl-ATP pyrophosphohydrolase
MASPRRIFTVYQLLFRNAAEIRDFQLAKGEPVSGTVQLLLSGDRDKLLRRWGEEMHEMCGVIGGTHDDPYILEATQCFYWGSLFAVSGGVDWEALGFGRLRTQIGQTGLDNVGDLSDTVERLVALGAEAAKPAKCFLLWHVADRLYRDITPPGKQWSHEQMMDYDLADMKKRPYLAPLLKQTEGL